ncbi:uncharacterized protein LACBIDRAFT_304230 [Laccaria bicolor S238N-H82]|uniref:Predicted protein n=1 Tax=Laccaria bicolor (strain S238N-H82 / ATCC MYA-4686) TaxID=486041 RepID=B0DL68_LACBS|nr:uncharacterized protein LACBIDRAFT_304230 [Laccaria bicolor S238N-H82]EDR04510.1 predicted protein [Laccaria bicolor S238N-H82]|eukprot:XP_001884682.1 predicted protein [Laccaria bicolor S238N-H82]
MQEQVRCYPLARGANFFARSIQAPPTNLCLKDEHIVDGVVVPRNWQLRVKPEWI